MKGYKVFNPDFTCKGMQFKENEIFEVSLPIAICNHGLHFCQKASDCFSYYSFDPNNIVCEVEALGEIQIHNEDTKACTNKLKINRKLTWQEVLFVANEGKDNTGYSNSGDSNSGDSNSGNRNSGDWNSGNWNSGNRNSGDWNSGNRNSGNWNSGNWNSGNRNSGDSNSGYRNSGAFCLDSDPVLWLFDKPTKMTVREWENSRPVDIMYRLLEIEIWVDSYQMTEKEKELNPSHKTTGGFLRHKTLKEAWADMWPNLSEEEKKEFTTLPNFDSDKFYQITGIKVEEK